MTRRRAPQMILLGAALVIAVSWAAVYVVDGLGVFGSPPVAGGTRIFVWEALFTQGPFEWAQWVLLGACVVVSGHLSGRLLEQDPGGAGWRFWAILSAGLTIMLLEDAGDMRLMLVAWASQLVGESIGPVPTRYAIELPYFAAMVFLPVYAVLRHGWVVLAPRATRTYAIAGFGTYAVVGSTHIPMGRLYENIGWAIDQAFAGGRMPLPEGRTRDGLHSALTDTLIEESLELVAAACLLAMAVAAMRGVAESRLALDLGGVRERSLGGSR